MNFIKNEKGITLVEVLATLTILSIVGIMVWNIFIQGSKYSSNSINKNLIQQEANIMSEQIKNLHKTSSELTILSENCSVLITTEKESITYSNDRYCYNLNPNGRYSPKAQHHKLQLNLEISDKSDSSRMFQKELSLYRLKGSEPDEETDK